MSRYVVGADWDDAPHLDDAAKAQIEASLRPHERDARIRGIPQLGAGAIYPFAESDIKIDPFEIPPHYVRGFGGDTARSGVTAFVWGAYDRDTDILYLYSVYRRTGGETAVHAEALKARGEWIPGVMDASDILDEDRTQRIYAYRRAGFDVILPDKAVEAGIMEVYDRLSAGKLRVFSSCPEWFEEFRLYRRDEKGRVVKKADHVMDACVVGETPVLTPAGPVPIRDLVGREGRALSRDGAWLRFSGARQTRHEAAVVRLAFEDGSFVVCTPDHPFLTPAGWVRADRMASQRCYNGVTQRIQCQSVLPARIRRFAAVATTVAASITSATAFGFIGSHGKRRTARFRAAWSSIIETAIRPTTRWRTWNSSRWTPILATTSAGTVGRSRLKPWWLPLHGIGAPRGGRGIGHTAPRRPRASRSSTSCANTATPRTEPFALEPTGFAPITAKPSRGRRLAWTMSNAVAWSVAAVFWRIATCGRPRARDAALLRCVGVGDAGRADVYCLTVPAASAFCLGNGAVVHNSRYLVHSGLQRAKRPPRDQPIALTRTYERDRGGRRSNLGWMR